MTIRIRKRQYKEAVRVKGQDRDETDVQDAKTLERENRKGESLMVMLML